MCSVVGYIGVTLSQSFVLEGLSRLEYRGYDSAGFACLNEQASHVLCVKSIGQISNLQKILETDPINGFVGIGHTRWASHGLRSVENAHPHLDCDKKIAVVHNGIVENHHHLRLELQAAGHIFVSETDTEVIAHLLEFYLTQTDSVLSAVVQLVNRIEGAFAAIIMMQMLPDQLILIRKQSPLCIGIGINEMFIASDVLAFADKADKVLFLPESTIALVAKNGVELFDFQGNPQEYTIQNSFARWSSQDKQGHAHYMLKEIYEQKNAVEKTVQYLESLGDTLWSQLGYSVQDIRSLERIKILGCGTSWHAGRIGQFFFEQVARIPVHVYLASEFRYMPFFPDSSCAYIALSQSGETADTLEALGIVKGAGLPTVAITNVASSSMVRYADGFLLTQAGPEIAVASTKAFSTQLAVLYWLANRIALEKGVIDKVAMDQAVVDLLATAQILQDTIALYESDIVTLHAKKYAHYSRAIFLGRHISYPFALESALKLKEIAYIFSQCYPAGELKHGPLALVDMNTPLFVFSLEDSLLYTKLLSNVQEAKARGTHIVVFAFEGQNELCALADLAFIIPRTNSLLGPLAMTGLMQFFVYSIARELQLPIDKPRNLAKSLTIE